MGRRRRDLAARSLYAVTEVLKGAGLTVPSRRQSYLMTMTSTMATPQYLSRPASQSPSALPPSLMALSHGSGSRQALSVSHQVTVG